MIPRHLGWIFNALLLVASVLLSLIAVEAIIAYAMSHPEMLGSAEGPVSKPLSLARNYYMRKDRRIVQFLPDCAVYDPEVTYTLKPSTRCTVVNREHSVEYVTNRMGLRDDDAALAAPAIVVTGDSHAIGWGVASAEAFPKLLQRDLGVAVLNAAISSYGTARELALVERLGLGDFKALVIQYCDNDFEENQYLVDRGHLDILPEARYRALVDGHARETRYYPFKHLRNLLSIARLALPWRKAPPPPPDTDATEARYFLDVLSRHQTLLTGKVVVVLELNEHNRNDSRFTAAVARLLDEPRYAALKPVVSTVDVAKALAASDYYLLDDHMRPVGHAKVAKLVEAELKRRGVGATK
ncbi:MAG: hypothetical protein IT562_15635 [Alphaproteobacteria bacterium]|nr:hypothetical protein [Alphaproteobacteria bacterium]